MNDDREKTAIELLRTARDLMSSFDQYPEPDQCVAMSSHAAKIAEFLKEESEWMKRWKDMEKAQADFVAKKELTEDCKYCGQLNKEHASDCPGLTGRYEL